MVEYAAEQQRSLVRYGDCIGQDLDDGERELLRLQPISLVHFAREAAFNNQTILSSYYIRSVSHGCGALPSGDALHCACDQHYILAAIGLSGEYGSSSSNIDSTRGAIESTLNGESSLSTFEVG